MDDYHEAEIRANFHIFAHEAEGAVGDVVSLKVRHTLNPEGETSNWFLYSEDYDALASDLNLPARTVGVYQGSGARPLGSGAVIIEHETGPELLLFVSQLTSAIDPVVTLASAVGIVVGMGRWVRARLEAARHKPPPYATYRDARCVRFERRRIGPDGTVDVAVLAVSSLDGTFDAEAIGAQLSTMLMSN